MCRNKGFIEEIRHNINPMHLYCRLCCLTTNKKKARMLVKMWENSLLCRFIYAKANRIRREEQNGKNASN